MGWAPLSAHILTWGKPSDPIIGSERPLPQGSQLPIRQLWPLRGRGFPTEPFSCTIFWCIVRTPADRQEQDNGQNIAHENGSQLSNAHKLTPLIQLSELVRGWELVSAFDNCPQRVQIVCMRARRSLSSHVHDLGLLRCRGASSPQPQLRWGNKEHVGVWWCRNERSEFISPPHAYMLLVPTAKVGGGGCLRLGWGCV